MKLRDRVKFLLKDQNAKSVEGILSMNPQMKTIQDALNAKSVDRKVLQTCLVEALKTLGSLEDWGILHRFTIDDVPRKDVYEALKRISYTIKP